MSTFVIILHIIVSIFLILVVLLQPGGKGGMGSAFGGAGGQTVFGGRGANTFLAKLTAAGAVVFMLTSFSLVYFSSRTSSVMDDEPSTPTAEAAADGATKDAATKDAATKDAATKDAATKDVKEGVKEAVEAAKGAAVEVKTDAKAAVEADKKPAVDVKPAAAEAPKAPVE